MTEQEVKAFLKSHFYATQKIKALTEEAELLSENQRNDIDLEIVELKKHQERVRQVIANLHDNDFESVLIYRYVLYNTEEQTADKLHYAPRTVQEKVKKAIKKICANWSK
jgi:DNA-directed RNA polymerase specialized sigma24 family protein